MYKPNDDPRRVWPDPNEDADTDYGPEDEEDEDEVEDTFPLDYEGY